LDQHDGIYHLPDFFLGLVEEGYHSNNPYHNAIHATDVTQAMHCFLQEKKVEFLFSFSEFLSLISTYPTMEFSIAPFHNVYLTFFYLRD